MIEILPLLLPLQISPLPSFSLCSADFFHPTLSVPPSFTFHLAVKTAIFPLTRSDYTRPPLAITFFFKSTQPPDLPRFRLLFGSTVVIKMLPGSLSLLSQVSFLLHRAVAIQHFSPFIPISSSHSFSYFPLSTVSYSSGFFSGSDCVVRSPMHFLFFLYFSHSPASAGCFNNCLINTSRP